MKEKMKEIEMWIDFSFNWIMLFYFWSVPWWYPKFPWIKNGYISLTFEVNIMIGKYNTDIGSKKHFLEGAESY